MRTGEERGVGGGYNGSKSNIRMSMDFVCEVMGTYY